MPARQSPKHRSSPKHIRAIYLDRKTLKSYRVTLRPGQYRVNQAGQYILPDGFYSIGYVERVSGSEWSDFPDIEHFPKLTYQK